MSAKTRDCSPTEEKWWNELRDQGLQIRRLQSEEGPLNSELYNRQQGHTGSTDEAKQLQSKVDAIEKDLEQHKTGFRNLLKIGAEKNYNVPIGDQRLTLIWQARPNYTEQARINNITGAVSVMAAFEANGNVSHCKVIQGLGFGLDENAVDALQRVLFLPEIQNGHFVSVFHRVKLNFVLM
ncbi:MAG TPA: energy transducer TonB [Blastocatellia bacterium]|nr:energy transducer TonB [Blastocatellia bacterium]